MLNLRFIFENISKAKAFSLKVQFFVYLPETFKKCHGESMSKIKEALTKQDEIREKNPSCKKRFLPSG